MKTFPLAQMLAKTTAILLALVCSPAMANPAVTKVEPPNWWPNHSLNTLQILIRGTDLAGASITGSSGVSVSNVRVNERGTYILMNIHIAPSAKPGNYPFQLRNASGTATVPFRLEEPLPKTGRFAGFSPDDVIYLIMPDRFANGDTANDDPAISRGMFDRNNSHFYHGGDLQGVIDHLPYLKSLGVTALWLTPVYDNTNTPNQRQAVAGKAIADYHGYGTVDYYGVEEHFGTPALLRKLVDSAHAMGLKVLQDQVANHVGPDHPWVTDSPKPTWFHGTASKHINETWQLWTLPDIHSSANAKSDVLDGWFADALPDMNQEDDDVAQYEIQNALWWVGEAGFDAIRQDTLPYVSRSFWRKWSAALKAEYPNLRAVGEVFDGDPVIPSFFQGGVKRPDGIDTGVDSVFDFPVYFNIRDVFAKGAHIDTLPKTLAKDRFYPNAEMLVTFLGNHDVMRYRNEGGATIDNLKLAFTFLFTCRGIPSFYYGDELGMPGGPDPDNRRDFPGGWKEDKRSAFDDEGRTDEERSVWNHVQKLLTIRAKTEALRRGSMIDLAVSDDAWVYARQSNSSAAIVAINNAAQETTLQIKPALAGAYISQIADGQKIVAGNASLPVRLPAHSAEIYIRR